MNSQDILRQLALLSPDERQDILSLLNDLEKVRSTTTARSDFLSFVKHLWPSFIEGYHHRRIAKLFDEVISGKKKRVIINLAPRHSKSEFSSIYLPAYFLGKYPDKKIIQASHTADLAVGFGRKVRNLVARADFQEVFPGTSLSADSTAAGKWATSAGGEYHAIGVGGAVAGKGADLFVIDDAHSEQEAVLAITNPGIYDKTMEWYEGGPRQRLQPGGAIIVVMTRWSIRDLTGQLLKKMGNEPGADQWEIVELPAILPSGNPIWPEFWSLDELLRTKASIPLNKWLAQYQQTPTAEEGALIKREYWRDWDRPKPPTSEIIIQSWDTAFTASTMSDYSACTTWGVFFNEEEDRNNIILLDSLRGKWEFPKLKEKALRYYEEWEPDICLIEGRAAGQPLIHELRMMGLPIQEVTVARGAIGAANTKVSRVNAISDIFASENVWAPKDRHFAQEVIEECASFPAGENDDYVDTVVMAMQRFREGGWIGSKWDWKEEKEHKRVREYY